MKENYAVYKGRIRSFQLSIMVIMVFLMVIGGTVFGLGVKTRPILRITRPETFRHVKWILDTMIAAAMAQLGTAGFDCFATCWKMIWPLYLAIGLTAMTVSLELGAIGTSLHLLHAADELANEEVVHPWYWVECEVTSGCHAALLNYMYYFVMPQVVLTALAIFLQCLAILTMGRMVRTVAEFKKTKSAYKAWYREHYEEVEISQATAKQEKRGSKSKPNSGIEMTPMKEEEENQDQDGAKQEDEDMDMNSDIVLSSPPSQPAPTPSFFNPNYHTPSSILKVDHGYVPASGGSLDNLDSPILQFNKGLKGVATRGGGGGEVDKPVPGGTPPSISFKADVQVHYYDQDAEILNQAEPDKLE